MENHLERVALLSPRPSLPSSFSPLSPLPSLLLTLLLSLLILGCDDRDVEREARLEQQKISAQNLCSEDSDCFRTGCRETLCRAAPDESTCHHRLVFELAPDADPTEAQEALKTHIGARLSRLEGETLRIYPMGDALLASFSASKALRQSIAEGLSGRGGFMPLHAQSKALTEEALETQRSQGGGPLSAVEGLDALRYPVRAGDILSKGDLRRAGAEAKEILPTAPEGGAWLFQLERGERSSFVIWLADLKRGVSFTTLERLKTPAEGVLQGELDPQGSQKLHALTKALEHQVILISVGDEVLASPVITAPITDGHFELNLTLEQAGGWVERLQALQEAPQLLNQVHFSLSRTQEAEADLQCLTQDPPLNRCGCVEGVCQMISSPELESCLNP